MQQPEQTIGPFRINRSKTIPGQYPHETFHPVPQGRIRDLEIGLAKVEEAAGKSKCNRFYRAIGHGRSLVEILGKRPTIYWAPRDRTAASGFADEALFGICITEKAFEEGDRYVALTAFHELAHLNGVRSVPIPNDRWSHYRCEQAALVCLDGWHPPVVANILWSLNYFKF
jgi:hypothetical protein